MTGLENDCTHGVRSMVGYGAGRVLGFGCAILFFSILSGLAS